MTASRGAEVGLGRSLTLSGAHTPCLQYMGSLLNFIAVEMTRSGLEFERRLPDMRASSGGVRVRISSSGLLHLLLFPFSSFTSAQTFSISIYHAFSLPYGILPLKPSRFATLTPHLTSPVPSSRHLTTQDAHHLLSLTDQNHSSSSSSER